MKKKIRVTIVYFLTFITFGCSAPAHNSRSKNTIRQKVEKNYGKKIDKLATKFELPPSYLKALIMLECSGNKNIIPRFENSIYQKLNRVKEYKLKKYENIKPKMLKNSNSKMLEELSKSWGPFQIMGYKCFWLGIKLSELKENSTYWGVVWINKTYGKKLRAANYKDAFHIHNTGKNYPKKGKPKTHDPKYVKNGLEYMELFKE